MAKDYLKLIAKEKDRIGKDAKRIIINPNLFNELLIDMDYPYNYTNMLFGMNILENQNVDTYLIDNGFDYESYLKEHMEEKEIDDVIHASLALFSYIKIPFFLTHSITELDKEIIKDRNLKIYAREGEDIYGDENTKEAMKFKWGTGTYLSDDNTDEMMEECIEMNKKHFMKQMINNIYKVLDKKMIVHDVLGYCNECEDCQGHVCGTITYHIDSFCPYDFKLSRLKVIYK